jgi:phosphoglycerate dehydrogenase-like enzyme
MTKLIRCDSSIFPITPGERATYGRSGVQVIEIEDPSLEILESHGEALGLAVVASKANDEVIDHLPKLMVISRYGSGTDNVAMDTATRNGIVVTRVPEFCLSEVADHTMALLLAAARKLPQMERSLRTGDWTARVTGGMRRVEGKQLGLIGFGLIAQQVAKRAKPFGLRTVVYDPYATGESLRAAGVEAVSLNDLLASSDFVSLHVPLTSETHHMIGREQLAAMKPGAILINTARGAVVEENALAAALESGHLGGAALDVFEGLNLFGRAPETIDHPLFRLPNVVLTPHAAACSEEALEELMSTGARNAVAVLEGRTPEHCVNPEVLPSARFRIREKSAATS